MNKRVTFRGANLLWIWLILLSIIFMNSSCGKREANGNSKFITGVSKQDSIFKSLMNLVNESIPETEEKDSLAFLILPIQASCPWCRKKIIESIVDNQKKNFNRRYVIISADVGRKTINSYFKEQGKELPEIPDKLFVDSVNRAYMYNLVDQKPVIYYTYDRKAYRMIDLIPATVRQRMHEFIETSN